MKPQRPWRYVGCRQSPGSVKGTSWLGWLALAIFGRRWCAAAGLFLITLSAQGYTNLTSAYSAMGFDPSAPGNAVVVFFSDPHMNSQVWAGISPILTTNLDSRLVNIVNAMDPPPARIVVAGDISNSYCPVPGGTPIPTTLILPGWK